MKIWDKDDSIVWKASVQHHSLWGKWYVDYTHIIDSYFPMLTEYKFDVYFNGHEHTLDYAYYPYS